MQTIVKKSAVCSLKKKTLENVMINFALIHLDFFYLDFSGRLCLAPSDNHFWGFIFFLSFVGGKTKAKLFQEATCFIIILKDKALVVPFHGITFKYS